MKYFFKNYVYIILLLLFWVNTSTAANTTPNITKYPDVLEDGKPAIIYGTDLKILKIKENMAFENFSGNTITNGNKLDLTSLKDPDGKYYYNSDAHSGSFSIKTNTYADPKANSSYLWYDFGKGVSELYFSFWTKIKFIDADTYELGGSQLKWYTVRSAPYAATSGWGAYPWFQKTNGEFEWKYFADAAVLGGVYSGGLLKYDVPTNDTWFRVEIYGKRNSAPGVADGTWHVVHLQPSDGKNITIINDNTYNTHNAGDLDWRYAMFLNNITNTETRAELNIWIDDFYVNTNQARIELGNKEIWTECTHREIQIPTKWNPRVKNGNEESIQFIVNSGSFSNGQSAYLFVVDDEGNYSAGKKIILRK